MDKEQTESAPVTISSTITVNELATKLGLKVTEVMSELIKNGVMATINDTIDFDTAAIIADNLGFTVVEETIVTEEKQSSHEKSKSATSADGDERPPIVAVMGHVDHGKTTLLDAIRGATVAAGEAGGITQHISAYQIIHNDRAITFLDTPGHEAFSLLREHGAHLTDVAIIVVAADDGVKPQTEEAIKFAKKAGVSMVVAITKMDKPGVDTTRLKQQLAELGLNPEEWGGDTVMVEVSAKTNQNIDKLLDMVLLVSDIDDLRARAKGAATGTVIEAHVTTGMGAVATLLIEEGELRVGDFVVVGEVYGRVRTMEDFTHKPIKTAGPSAPVFVSGWKTIPPLGGSFQVVASEKAAKGDTQLEQRSSQMLAATEVKSISHQDKLEAAMASSDKKQLGLVIKADVDGSLQSVIQSLESLGNDEVGIKIVSSGIGVINESDVNSAVSAGATLIGFNVILPGRIKQLAVRSGVAVKLYTVIYELLDDVKAQLGDMLDPEMVEEILATLTVKGIFRITKQVLICGGLVTKGSLVPKVFVRKAGEEAEFGSVRSVQHDKQTVKEVKKGELCGLEIETHQKSDVALDDTLEFFTRTAKARTL